MTTTSEARFGINAYEEWLEREGIPVHHGLALNLFELETRDWPRYGAKGAAAHFTGSGDYCNMFVLELPAGAATPPQRHLYEEIYYVSGRQQQLEFAETVAELRTGPRFLFVLLNAKHRHFNSGTRRSARDDDHAADAVNCSQTSSFETLYELSRSGRDAYLRARRLDDDPSRQQHLETNFVPGRHVNFTPWEDRGRADNICSLSRRRMPHLEIDATYERRISIGGTRPISGTHSSGKGGEFTRRLTGSSFPPANQFPALRHQRHPRLSRLASAAACFTASSRHQLPRRG